MSWLSSALKGVGKAVGGISKTIGGATGGLLDLGSLAALIPGGAAIAPWLKALEPLAKGGKMGLGDLLQIGTGLVQTGKFPQLQKMGIFKDMPLTGEGLPDFGKFQPLDWAKLLSATKQGKGGGIGFADGGALGGIGGIDSPILQKLMGLFDANMDTLSKYDIDKQDQALKTSYAEQVGRDESNSLRQLGADFDPNKMDTERGVRSSAISTDANRLKADFNANLDSTKAMRKIGLTNEVSRPLGMYGNILGQLMSAKDWQSQRLQNMGMAGDLMGGIGLDNQQRAKKFDLGSFKNPASAGSSLPWWDLGTYTKPPTTFPQKGPFDLGSYDKPKVSKKKKYDLGSYGSVG